MERICAFATALLLLLLPLTSCKVKDPLAGLPIERPPLVLDDENAISESGLNKCDEGYIYYQGKELLVLETGAVELTTLWRYNTTSGKSEPTCRDAACSHKAGSGCPFEAASVKAPGVYNSIPTFTVKNGIIYFIAPTLVDGKIPPRDAQYYLCSYNTRTMEYKELTPYKLFDSFTLIWLTEEYIYYVQEVPHTEDNGDDDYFFRYALRDGRIERLFTFNSETIGMYKGILPLCFYDDQILFYRYQLEQTGERFESTLQIVGYDLTSDAKEEILSEKFTDSGVALPRLDVAGDRVYFEKSDTDKKGVNLCYIDLKTGKEAVYIENVAIGTRVCGKYICYFPYEPTTVTIDGLESSHRSLGKIIVHEIETGAEKLYQSKYPIDFSCNAASLYYYQGKLYGRVMLCTQELTNEYRNDLIAGTLAIAYDIKNDSFVINPME